MGEFGFGQSIRRKEDPRLLTGRGRYIDDRHLPGECHCIVLRSPHAHARIRAVETAAAAAASGVVAVLTGADLASDGIGGVPCDYSFPAYPPDRDCATALVRPPHPALAADTVRYVGEGVA